MIPARADPRWATRAAILFGLGASFVVAVDLVRAIRPRVLLDSDPGWAAPRLLLGLAVAAAAAAAGAAAAAVFRGLARTPLFSAPLVPLALPARGAALLAAGALCAGLAVRLAGAQLLAIPFLEDEVNLATPALELSGTAGDFRDAIRPIPYGRPDPHEMIGVLYLRLLRRSLDVFGTTPFAIRAPSLLAGALSLVTATLLSRALLPRGGAALAALVLAGLRWHVILSWTGWHSILLAPLADTAALLLLRSRRTSGSGRLEAAAAGAVAGIGAHFYLASWIAAAGLAGFAVWPRERPEPPRVRLSRAALFAAGFALLAAPLFLFAEGRRVPYFGRASRHSVVREMRIAGSPLPLFAAAADALPAPWLLPDPEGRHDLAGASRLGWLVGIPVAIALARALLSPRAELSALLLAQAAAAFFGAVAAGQAGHPNGFRFGYLTTPAAVAAAAGGLALAGLAKPRFARAAALAVVGAFAVAGARGIVQAGVLWPAHRATFESFHGEDTLLGAAAARWERQGDVRVAPGLGRNDLTIETVRRYRLAGGLRRETTTAPGSSRRFRIDPPGTSPTEGWRVVESIRDGRGREWGEVLGRRDAP